MSRDQTSLQIGAKEFGAAGTATSMLFSPAESQQLSLDDRLLSVLGSRFAELGFLQFERMDTGAEATAITKVTARGEFVLKAIDETRADEEVRQISRIERHVPGFFPRIVHAQTDAGLYAIEFVAGTPLDVALNLPAPSGESVYELPPPIGDALDLLRRLHKVTSRTYSGNYHNVIVHHRAQVVPRCPRIAARFGQLCRDEGQAEHSWCTTDVAKSLDASLAKVRDRYDPVKPPTESLIHGDPHLGNIIAKRDGGVCFIDPRVTWDGIKNPDPGYFDPLYDPACVAHSVIANTILKRDGGLNPMIEAAEAILRRYLSRAAEDAERTRYLTYVACALLGNLRYTQWTPKASEFQSTTRVVQTLLTKILT